MPPITLGENSGDPVLKEYANGSSTAEEKCVGSWTRDDEYFQLNFTDKLVRFNSWQGGGYEEPYEVSGDQIRFFEGDEEFAIECTGEAATITKSNIVQPLVKKAERRA